MKFIFSDKVKVVSGFYQGMIGYVTDYSGVDNTYYFEGYHIVDTQYRGVSRWINAQELEKVEE